MAVYYSPENLAIRAASIATVPAASPQYSAKGGIDGQLGRPVRVTASPGNWAIDVDLGSVQTGLQAFALFDCYGRPTNITVQSKPSAGGSYTTHASGLAECVFTRDGSHHVYIRTTGLDARWIRILAAFPAVGLGQFAEVWIGRVASLSRDPTDRQDQILHANTVTIGPSGVVSAVKLGPARRAFRLRFEKLRWDARIPTGTEHPDFEALFVAADGASNPILLDVDGQPYHGRLSNDPTWGVDAPVVESHDLTFTESGRAPLVLG